MTYGPDAVHALIVESEWSYPVTSRRLEQQMPMEKIVIDEDGNSMMLAEFLHEADVERFESPGDLKRKLQPVCEAESKARRFSVPSGEISQHGLRGDYPQTAVVSGMRDDQSDPALEPAGEG